VRDGLAQGAADGSASDRAALPGGAPRGTPELPLLEEAVRISARPALPERRRREDAAYFIGKCLLDRRDRRAVRYLRNSVARSPWRVKSWAALVAAHVVCGGAETR
jgi:hypothetical protein